MTDLLADISAPFFDTTKPFRNWSALPFYQLDLPHPPYVDRSQLERGVDRALSYLAQLHAQGYTGVVIDNLAHLVTLDGAPQPIYAASDPCRLRALIYQEAFDPLFARAAALGMAVYITTDMQWATAGVRQYVGRLTPTNPRLVEINRCALRELFERFPQVAGVFVRVGEAGGAHNHGSAYTGHMIYRTARDLRRLLESLLPTCEAAGRRLVVRTWSIGIGKLGDLMWSPDRYQAVFSGLTSPSLIVSIKHGPSDFFRQLPPNPTLGLPGPKQLIELQNRREYELFGMIPSSIAALHAGALRRFLASPQAAGIWAWNGTGGWGGGTAALGDTGWSLWTELSSALTAALAQQPELEPRAFVRDWCTARFGRAAPGFADAVAALYLESADLLERGWYFGELQRAHPTLGRLHIPPLLWVWWMRPTAAPLIWAYLASATRDPARAIQAAADAVGRLGWHLDQLTACCPAADPQAAWAIESARYLRDCVAVSHAMRALLLPGALAARQGDRALWDALMAQAPVAQRQLRAHRATWGGRLDFPALELDEIERYLGSLRRSPSAHWAYARAVGAVVVWLVTHRPSARALRPRAIAMLTLAALVAGHSKRAPQLALIVAIGLLGRASGLPLLARAARWACRRWFLLPSIFFETGPDITEWLA